MSESLKNTAIVGSFGRDDSYVDIYANQIRLGVSLSDLTIIFGATDDLGPNQLVSKDKAAIRLSVTNAKILMLNLQTMVEAYENGIGKIRLPRGSIEAMGAISMQIRNMLHEQVEPLSDDQKTLD